MSTPLRKTVRNVKFAIAPSVRSRVTALAKRGVLPRSRIVARAKAIGSRVNRLSRIKAAEKQFAKIQAQVNAIEGKKGKDAERGRLLTQSIRVQKRLLALRNPKLKI
jgi:hypothetical protein